MRGLSRRKSGRRRSLPGRELLQHGTLVSAETEAQLRTGPTAQWDGRGWRVCHVQRTVSALAGPYADACNHVPFDPLTALGWYAPAVIAIGMMHASFTDRVGAFLRVSGAVISLPTLIFVSGRIWLDTVGAPWMGDERTVLAHLSAICAVAQLAWLLLAVVERFHRSGRTTSDLPPAR